MLFPVVYARCIPFTIFVFSASANSPSDTCYRQLMRPGALFRDNFHIPSNSFYADKTGTYWFLTFAAQVAVCIIEHLFYTAAMIHFSLT